MKISKQHKARQLRIYRASSGQWSGRLTVGPHEVAMVIGCETPEDVRQLVGADARETSIGPRPSDDANP